jgi:hypothetical protein
VAREALTQTDARGAESGQIAALRRRDQPGLARVVLHALLVVGSTWLSDRRAHGLLDAAETIVSDAVPAISHLSSARTALRKLEVTLNARSAVTLGTEVVCRSSCASRCSIPTSAGPTRERLAGLRVGDRPTPDGGPAGSGSRFWFELPCA